MPRAATAPEYMSKRTLAAALDIAESTVDEFVRRGVLPHPVRLSSGCVRWRWETVDQALVARGEQSENAPLSVEEQGVARAIQAAKDRGRDRAA